MKESQCSVKMPKSLRDKVSRIAKNERRSFTAQVVFFIEQAVSRQATAK